MKAILCEENGYKLIVEKIKKNEEIESVSNSDVEAETIELEFIETEEKDSEIDQEGTIAILKRFVKNYCENKKNRSLNLEEWLVKQLKKEFPEKDDELLKVEAQEIISGVLENEKTLLEIKKYRKFGIKPSDYLGEAIAEELKSENVKEAREILKENNQSIQESNVKDTYKFAGYTCAEIVAGTKAFNKMDTYFDHINETIARGNEKTLNLITTKTGDINQNQNLDGFIFESFHEATFNIDAALKDIQNIRAEALVPKPGASYGKNSVDLVIKIEKNGVERIIKKYQAKLSTDGKNATNLYEKGNYKFQRKLFGKGQEEYGNTKVEYNGIESRSVSKSEMKELQNKLQKQGNKNVVQQNFKNDIDVKALAKQIGKQALYSGVIATGLGMLMSTGSKIIQGEDVAFEDVVVDGLKAGGTVGISTAVAGGLKTAVEKGVIEGTIGRFLSKNSVISTIAFSTIGLVATAYSIGKGDMNMEEGLKETGNILSSAYCGIKGASIGMGMAAGILTVGSVLTPLIGIVGGVVGSFVGNEVGSVISKGVATIGQSVSSIVGNMVKEGIQQVRNEISMIGSFFKVVENAVGSLFKAVGNLFSYCFF